MEVKAVVLGCLHFRAGYATLLTLGSFFTGFDLSVFITRRTTYKLGFWCNSINPLVRGTRTGKYRGLISSRLKFQQNLFSCFKVSSLQNSTLLLQNHKYSHRYSCKFTAWLNTSLSNERLHLPQALIHQLHMALLAVPLTPLKWEETHPNHLQSVSDILKSSSLPLNYKHLVLQKIFP